MAGEFTSSSDIRRGYITYVSELTQKVKHKEIKYAIVNGRAVFEGDIVIGTEESIAAAEEEGARRLARDVVLDVVSESVRPGDVVRVVVQDVVHACIVVGSQYRWPNGVIPFAIDPNLPNQQRVTDAIAHWEDNTPIRFVERDGEDDFVTFIPANGCWSYVGRQGGEQEIGLAGGCDTGNTIHEIGHAVGLWHEQSREDRDEHVTVHLENVIAGYEHNFDQHIADGDDVGPYDYDSIMHYPRDAFSKNGDTITPPDGVTIGQRERLSDLDIAAVVYMYGTGIYYIGNARTKELHVWNCAWVGLMAQRNKKYIWTIDEAVNSGYNGCYYCLRAYDTG